MGDGSMFLSKEGFGLLLLLLLLTKSEGGSVNGSEIGIEIEIGRECDGVCHLLHWMKVALMICEQLLVEKLMSIAR